MSEQYEGEDRRHTDPIQTQIEQLIMEAGDPRDKAMLLILNRIAIDLGENTNLTRALIKNFKDHTTAFEVHEKKELALINQGRGFYRAAIGGLFILQALGVFWIKGHLEENMQTRKDVDRILIQFAEHKAKHEQSDKLVAELINREMGRE